MTLNPLKLVEQLIEEHGSSTIQAKHLSMLRDQISLLQKENATLHSENTILKSQNQNLTEKLNEIKPVKKGEECPFCHQPTGQLKELRAPKASLLRQMGIKEGQYQCQNPECGNNFEKQIKA